MKAYYRIGEIARLYGLNADTLRYYEEQGLLHPARDEENGYRLYTIRDVCTLNVIRSLRSLDVSTREIGGYLSQRSVETTARMLRREHELLGERLDALTDSLREVERREEQLRYALSLPDGVCSLRTLPARPCVRLAEGPIPEPEVDMALKKLEKRHESLLYKIHAGRMGAVIDPASVRESACAEYSSVFFLSDGADSDGALPAGEYACVCYRGPYSRLVGAWRTLREFAAHSGREIAGAPLELYHIDAHDTDRPAEYVTEVQVQTKISKKA